MKLVATISKTIPIFKDPYPPRWVPIGFLNSSFWLLIMLFTTTDPKHLDQIEKRYFNNPKADNDGFIHTPQMTVLAGCISLLSLVSSIFITSRSVKEFKKVGDAFQLINWRSKPLIIRNFYQTDKGWPSRVPIGLRTWDAVVVADGKKYFVNTRGKSDFLKDFTSQNY